MRDRTRAKWIAAIDAIFTTRDRWVMVHREVVLGYVAATDGHTDAVRMSERDVKYKLELALAAYLDAERAILQAFEAEDLCE